MVTSFISWIKSLAAKAFAFVATFFAGFTYGKIKEKNKQLKAEKQKAEKQAEKLNAPSLRGDDLIDGL